jgi:hypothetical protein
MSGAVPAAPEDEDLGVDGGGARAVDLGRHGDLRELLPGEVDDLVEVHDLILLRRVGEADRRGRHVGRPGPGLGARGRQGRRRPGQQRGCGRAQDRTATHAGHGELLSPVSEGVLHDLSSSRLSSPAK